MRQIMVYSNWLLILLYCVNQHCPPTIPDNVLRNFSAFWYFLLGASDFSEVTSLNVSPTFREKFPISHHENNSLSVAGIRAQTLVRTHSYQYTGSNPFPTYL